MKKKTVASAIFLTLLSLLVCTAQPALAAIELMDGKLILNGFAKNTTYVRTSVYNREFDHGPGSNHDSRVDFSNFSFLLEALYTVKNTDDLTVRFFGGVKYWYETSMRLDDNLRRHMYHEQREDYISPENFEKDMITEAYVDFISGPWQVRLGKQIVIWGQLDVNRVADVVNPLDLRFGVPGVDTWEEVKRGLWMMRAFYQSDLPGMLLFEVIFNPGDFRGLMLPYQGTHWGPEYFKNAQFVPDKERGMFSWLQEKMLSDQPSWNLKENYEFGGRIRGFTWNIDWTLVYWNARADGPTVASPSRISAYAFQYVRAGLKAMATDSYLDPGEPPRQRVFKYKRYQTVGGTAQTFVNWLADSVWRLEWFYEIGSPMNKGENGNTNSVYKEVRRDILGIAIQGNWKLDIPWWTRTIGTGKQTDVSVTFFREQVFNHDHDLTLADRFHPYEDSTVNSTTLFIKQEMFNTSWVFIFIGNYYFKSGKWMAVPSFTYIFPESVLSGGLRADIGAKLYGGARSRFYRNNSLSHLMDHKDSLILRLRYEF